MSQSVHKKALRFREMLPKDRAKFCSRGTQEAYMRILLLLPDIVDQLEEAKAPFHVWRWVSYGKTIADRVVRTALALHFRYEKDDKKVWLQATEQNTAEKLFYKTPQGSTARDWLRGRVFTMSGKGGSMDPAFWREINQRVQVIDRTTFVIQVQQCVELKPKRKSPKKRGALQHVLTAKKRRALRELLAELLASDPDAAELLQRVRDKGDK